MGGNTISRAHGNTNIFIRFATAAFATSGQSFVRLKIAFDMSQGRKLAYYSTVYITYYIIALHNILEYSIVYYSVVIIPQIFYLSEKRTKQAKSGYWALPLHPLHHIINTPQTVEAPQAFNLLQNTTPTNQRLPAYTWLHTHNHYTATPCSRQPPCSRKLPHCQLLTHARSSIWLTPSLVRQPLPPHTLLPTESSHLINLTSDLCLSINQQLNATRHSPQTVSSPPPIDDHRPLPLHHLSLHHLQSTN